MILYGIKGKFDGKKTLHKTKLKSAIRETLVRINAINNKRVVVLSSQTRDNKNLKVYQDAVTKVIFIDDYYVGDDEYVSGEYREKTKPLIDSSGRDYEDLLDSERRFKSYRQFITAKNICDFGCGAGSFLKLSQTVANKSYGIELQHSYADALNNIGIDCYPKLENIKNPLDVISLFHCFEHLPDPASTLRDLHVALKKKGDGTLIIEVPHARDFLIDHLKNQDFIG